MTVDKIIFLDVDGVLNMYSSGGHMADAVASNTFGMALNKKRLQRLNRIVDATDAKIILSSTWRKLPYALRKITNVLGYRGIKIFDCTPVFYTLKGIRGDEIQYCLSKYKPNTYVILDDDSDMLPEQLPFFVKTDGDKGLTEEDVDKAISILNSKNQYHWMDV